MPLLPVLMVVHGEEELLHELYLVLLRPVLEVVQAHAPDTGVKTADQGSPSPLGGVPVVRNNPVGLYFYFDV